MSLQERTKLSEFKAAQSNIDLDKLRLHLCSLSKPCWENELLAVAFPEIDAIKSDPLELFRGHFLLFNALYRLKTEFEKDNKFLHIHFMRTFLTNYPENGRCRRYLEESGTFCNAKTEGIYCKFHSDQFSGNYLDDLSEQYYYLDWKNYYSLTADTAESFLNGTWELMQNYDEYKKCLKVLDLPEKVSLEILKKRFRFLAKTLHPDVSEVEAEKFSEVNTAYRRLLKFIKD